MKQFRSLTIAVLALIACIGLSCSESDSSSTSPSDCGTHNGNQLYLGPQGGCYYYNSNGNKTYVDRSECNC